MDIVGRLKAFIDFLGVPVTQFADNCGIPRPTLSQLLNGRNKTVRDELIAKIHDAYPSLSVMWLLFGEGTMTKGADALPQQGPSPSPRENAIFESAPLPFAENDNLGEVATGSLQPSAQPAQPDDDAAPRAIDFAIDGFGQPAVGDEEQAPYFAKRPDEGAKQPQRTISFTSPAPQPGEGKRIVNIIVYYSDNSYQSFVPDPNPTIPLPR